MDLLQVPDDGLDTPVGVRPHANSESANKDKLQPYYVEKALPNGKTGLVLNSFLDIMYRIFATPCSLALVIRTRFMPIWWI